MNARMRAWVRSLGIALLAVSLTTFVLIMFVISGAYDPIKNIAIGTGAGLGITLILLALPRSNGETGPETRRVLLSVFFTFGTLGPLIMMVVTNGEANFLVGIAGILVSGGLSLLWATTFTRRVFWLIPIAIVVSAIGPQFLFRTMYEMGGFANFFGLSLRMRLGILGIESLVCLVLGYTLMIRFVSRVERAGARSEAELETASRIHAQLVPAIERDLGAWSVRARSVPSSTMGGDLIDLVVHADGSGDLVLADVAGHGVRAGVVMAMAKGIVWSELAGAGTLSDAAGRINRSLTDLLDVGTFVTAVVARLPANAGEPAEIVVAGHPPAIIRRADGTTEPVGTHGLPWGIERGETYTTTAVSLAPGDAIALYSDGLTEATTVGGAMLGIAGVDGAVRTHADPGSLARAMLDGAERHAGGRAMTDDCSVAVAWRRSD